MSKFAVYAGHGGKDPGAVSGSRNEKDYTLKVMTALTKFLKNAGHTVINNRTTDVNRSITADVKKANEAKVDAVIEIHLNSNAGTPGSGTETYYLSGSTKGKAMAKAVHDRIVALGFRDRGIKTGTWAVIKNTSAPAILIETAFINNDSEMKKYDCDKMANAIFAGLISIYGGKGSSNQNGSSSGSSNNSSSNDSTASSDKVPYTINVTASSGLNVRSGPGTSYSIREAIPKSNVKYTIVEEKNGWGRLKSGAGWIYLKYTKKA